MLAYRAQISYVHHIFLTRNWYSNLKQSQQNFYCCDEFSSYSTKFLQEIKLTTVKRAYFLLVYKFWSSLIQLHSQYGVSLRGKSQEGLPCSLLQWQNVCYYQLIYTRLHRRFCCCLFLCLAETSCQAELKTLKSLQKLLGLTLNFQLLPCIMFVQYAWVCAVHCSVHWGTPWEQWRISCV